MMLEAIKYVGRIRNPAKHSYALAYLRWIDSGKRGNAPEYDGNFLSYMAAQAVRLNIEGFLQ